MGTRVKTALLLGPIVLGVVLFGGQTLLAVLAAGVAAGSVFEYLKLANPKALPAEKAFASVWAVFIVLAFLSPIQALPGALLVVGAFLFLAVNVFGSGSVPHIFPKIGALLGAWLLAAYPLGCLVWIRSFNIGCVLFVLALVWCGDTAAYYAGTYFGKHRLAPLISPKKSIEGSIASLLAGGGVGLLGGLFIPEHKYVLASVCLGLALNVAAQLGDLVESLFKRSVGVKDSGNILPGHGGLLDRVDGFLPTLPLYAAYLILLGAI